MIKNIPKMQLLGLFLCIGLCLSFFAVRSLQSDLPHKRNTPLVYDLNTATADELDEIPGMKPSLAKAIVAYRESYGKYVDIEELLNVRGMSEEIYQEIQKYITLGGA